MDYNIHYCEIDGMMTSIMGRDVIEYEGPRGEVFHETRDAEWLALEELDMIRQNLNKYHKFLEDTDYVACKIAEGAATREEYAEILEQRAIARQYISEHE